MAAKQVVRWLMDEERAGRRRLQTNATRQYLNEDIPKLEQHHLGDVEREDIYQITAVGVLELTPPDMADTWLLRLRIEDNLGGRLPDYASASDKPEEIDLATFQETFIVPERGPAFVAVDADTDEAWSTFQELLNEMRANRHSL